VVVAAVVVVVVVVVVVTVAMVVRSIIKILFNRNTVEVFILKCTFLVC